jgi:hypothetical protein
VRTSASFVLSCVVVIFCMMVINCVATNVKEMFRSNMDHKTLSRYFLEHSIHGTKNVHRPFCLIPVFIKLACAEHCFFLGGWGGHISVLVSLRGRKVRGGHNMCKPWQRSSCKSNKGPSRFFIIIKHGSSLSHIFYSLDLHPTTQIFHTLVPKNVFIPSQKNVFYKKQKYST